MAAYECVRQYGDMKKKIQIKLLFGSVLFEHECKDNSIRKTLEAAVSARAHLADAYLAGAYLAGAQNADYAIVQTVLTPEGTLIGWKKCRDNVLVKLRIPEEAKRSNASSRKCRAEYVDVLELISLDDTAKTVDNAVSIHDGKTMYRVGERVMCDKWDDDRWNECSGGIHFYITRLEAENHN